MPNTGAYSINAFHISWKDLTFYAFPPFCIIQRVLQKITEEEATGILVAPYWPTQSWWPYLTNMLINVLLIGGYLQKQGISTGNPIYLGENGTVINGVLIHFVRL